MTRITAYHLLMPSYQMVSPLSYTDWTETRSSKRLQDDTLLSRTLKLSKESMKDSVIILAYEK